jgi:hypothetical protein
MRSQLSVSNQRTYDAIFGHPVARRLPWREVHTLLDQVCEVAEQPNGKLKATCNGQTLVMHPAHDGAVADIDEVMALRRFLKKVVTEALPAEPSGAHLLVVIDHRQARVYKTELHGTVPQRVTPLNPGGVDRQLHYVQDASNGQRKPELKSFYEAVIKTLQGAEKILIFGSGTGASSAMTHLGAELRRRHGRLARSIVGEVVLDQQHLSEDQLLAAARAFYARHGVAGAAMPARTCGK